MIRAALKVLVGLTALVTFTLALNYLDQGLRRGGASADTPGARLALLAQR